MWICELGALSCVLRQLCVCPAIITCEGIATREARWTTSHLEEELATFGLCILD